MNENILITFLLFYMLIGFSTLIYNIYIFEDKLTYFHVIIITIFFPMVIIIVIIFIMIDLLIPIWDKLNQPIYKGKSK